LKEFVGIVVLVCAAGAGSWYDYCFAAADVETAAPGVAARVRVFERLQILLILGVLLVYAALASQSKWPLDPLAAMFPASVAALGAVATPKLTATTFHLQAYTAVIMRAGIVVSNAILLVGCTSVLRRRDGLLFREAGEQTGRTWCGRFS
jgi:multidrug efflux pump subunit AcrB